MNRTKTARIAALSAVIAIACMAVAATSAGGQDPSPDDARFVLQPFDFRVVGKEIASSMIRIDQRTGETSVLLTSMGNDSAKEGTSLCRWVRVPEPAK